MVRAKRIVSDNVAEAEVSSTSEVVSNGIKKKAAPKKKEVASTTNEAEMVNYFSNCLPPTQLRGGGNLVLLIFHSVM